MQTSPRSEASMPAEAQRMAMLGAMGIDVYRLRTSPAAAAPLRVGVDARAYVCVDGGDEESAERLLAVLSAALGVARARVTREAVADDGAIIEIDASALRANGAAKRGLWNALKPLARRLREAD
jgi:hypothetical protein